MGSGEVPSKEEAETTTEANRKDQEPNINPNKEEGQVACNDHHEPNDVKNLGDDDHAVPRRSTGLFVFFKDARKVVKLDELGVEIAHIAVPAALALAADPLASLVDTAFVGRIGPVELAAVGVSIAVFNQVSRIAIYPLVSVTTSFVAEERAACMPSKDGAEIKDVEKAIDHQQSNEVEVKPQYSSTECVAWIGRSCGGEEKITGKKKKTYIPSVSSAMVVGAILGLLQAFLLISAGKPLLRIMGIKPGSPMMAPAHQYLTLRAVGSPAVLLALAMLGVFRGFKDTKTTLYATVIGDMANIILDAVFILVFRWGVRGAAIAHVISQYLISLILLGKLLQLVEIFPSSIKDLKFRRFLRCGFLLLARVIAVTSCVTLAASMAARQGPVPMAAFQICLQLWLSTSLLADGLAVAGQAILASAFAVGDKNKAMLATSRVLQLSVLLGLGLSAFLGVFMHFGASVFTKSTSVIKLVHLSIPFVAGSQTVNSLAFVFDGVNFGASDYRFSAYSMVVVAVISIVGLFLLSASHGFIGIWISMIIYISLRAFAGVWRVGAARGPWSFLRQY